MIDKSFGFDTAVEEAQRAINAAHVEVESIENGVGIVKLMGRYSGKGIDCCVKVADGILVQNLTIDVFCTFRDCVIIPQDSLPCTPLWPVETW